MAALIPIGQMVAVPAIASSPVALRCVVHTQEGGSAGSGHCRRQGVAGTVEADRRPADHCIFWCNVDTIGSIGGVVVGNGVRFDAPYGDRVRDRAWCLRFDDKCHGGALVAGDRAQRTDRLSIVVKAACPLRRCSAASAGCQRQALLQLHAAGAAAAQVAHGHRVGQRPACCRHNRSNALTYCQVDLLRAGGFGRVDWPFAVRRILVVVDQRSNRSLADRSPPVAACIDHCAGIDIGVVVVERVAGVVLDAVGVDARGTAVEVDAARIPGRGIASERVVAERLTV